MFGRTPVLRRSGLFLFCVVWIPTLDASAAAVTRMESHQRLTERVEKGKRQDRTRQDWGKRRDDSQTLK